MVAQHIPTQRTPLLHPRAIDAVLVALLVFDGLLVLWAFAAPDLWFQTWHNSLSPTPAAELFLKRCGANWAGFFLFQLLALRHWRSQPFWLAIVAGLRFSDIFTDATYALFAPDLTPIAWLSLPLAGLLNFALGCYFLAAHLRLSRARRRVRRPAERSPIRLRQPS
jgi:hypothetical protein